MGQLSKDSRLVNSAKYGTNKFHSLQIYLRVYGRCKNEKELLTLASSNGRTSKISIDSRGGYKLLRFKMVLKLLLQYFSIIIDQKQLPHKRSEELG